MITKLAVTFISLCLFLNVMGQNEENYISFQNINRSKPKLLLEKSMLGPDYLYLPNGQKRIAYRMEDSIIVDSIRDQSIGKIWASFYKQLMYEPHGVLLFTILIDTKKDSCSILFCDTGRFDYPIINCCDSIINYITEQNRIYLINKTKQKTNKRYVYYISALRF